MLLGVVRSEKSNEGVEDTLRKYCSYGELFQKTEPPILRPKPLA